MKVIRQSQINQTLQVLFACLCDVGSYIFNPWCDRAFYGFDVECDWTDEREKR